MGEIGEELGRLAKIFLSNLWRSLDPSTKQRIEAVLFPALKIALVLALTFLSFRLITALIRDLAKAPAGGSAIMAKASAFWRSLSAHRRRIHAEVIPAVALLFLAAFGAWPYNFYILTRIAVCVTSAWMAFQLHANRRFLWECGLIIVALLFNPIAPFHFSKETWALFNVLAALTLAPGIFVSVGIKRVTTLPIDLPMEESRYCQHCGVSIGGADLFCRRCGASLRPVRPRTRPQS